MKIIKIDKDYKPQVGDILYRHEKENIFDESAVYFILKTYKNGKLRITRQFSRIGGDGISRVYADFLEFKNATFFKSIDASTCHRMEYGDGGNFKGYITNCVRLDKNEQSSGRKNLHGGIYVIMELNDKIGNEKQTFKIYRKLLPIIISGSMDNNTEIFNFANLKWSHNSKTIYMEYNVINSINGYSGVIFPYCIRMDAFEQERIFETIEKHINEKNKTQQSI